MDPNKTTDSVLNQGFVGGIWSWGKGFYIILPYPILHSYIKTKKNQSLYHLQFLHSYWMGGGLVLMGSESSYI